MRHIDDLAPGEYVLGVEAILLDEYDPTDPTHLGSSENPLAIPVRLVAKFSSSEGRDAGHWERADTTHHLIFTDELNPFSNQTLNPIILMQKLSHEQTLELWDYLSQFQRAYEAESPEEIYYVFSAYPINTVYTDSGDPVLFEGDSYSLENVLGLFRENTCTILLGDHGMKLLHHPDRMTPLARVIVERGDYFRCQNLSYVQERMCLDGEDQDEIETKFGLLFLSSGIEAEGVNIFRRTPVGVWVDYKFYLSEPARQHLGDTRI